jgi:hypothetical protein
MSTYIVRKRPTIYKGSRGNFKKKWCFWLLKELDEKLNDVTRCTDCTINVVFRHSCSKVTHCQLQQSTQFLEFSIAIFCSSAPELSISVKSNIVIHILNAVLDNKFITSVHCSHVGDSCNFPDLTHSSLLISPSSPLTWGKEENSFGRNSQCQQHQLTCRLSIWMQVPWRIVAAAFHGI